MLSESFEVIGRGITLMPSKAVLRINRVPFFHTGVAMGFGKDGCGSNGNAARIALDERFLFDENIKLHRVNQKIIRLNGELLQRGGHGLAAGLINVPRVDALCVNFSDGPGQSMQANARGEFRAALGNKFFGIIEADNAALWIQNDRGRDNGPKERAAAGFIETGDAHPTELSRRSLETGRAETAHCAKILARRSTLLAPRFSLTVQLSA